LNRTQKAVLPKLGFYVLILTILSLSTLVISFARESIPITSIIQNTNINKDAADHMSSFMEHDNVEAEGITNKRFSDMISAAVGAAKIIVIAAGGTADENYTSTDLTPIAQR
jgi:hypothetical protein